MHWSRGCRGPRVNYPLPNLANACGVDYGNEGVVDATSTPAQIAGMTQNATLDLEKLARDAAEQVAGADAVEQVEVVAGDDYTDRPVYRFTFLINHDLLQERIGMVGTRLHQRLRDELIAMGDEHYPVVQILDRKDWDRRDGA